MSRLSGQMVSCFGHAILGNAWPSYTPVGLPCRTTAIKRVRALWLGTEWFCIWQEVEKASKWVVCKCFQRGGGKKGGVHAVRGSLVLIDAMCMNVFQPFNILAPDSISHLVINFEHIINIDMIL